MKNMSDKKDFIDLEIESELRDIVKDRITTENDKKKFISQMKAGLGEEIKKNPRGIVIHKKTRWENFTVWLKKIFTKF